MKQLAVLGVVLLAGCTQPGRPEASNLSSTIVVSDPRITAQLLNGFHSVEEHAWRWTTGHFEARLGAPPGAQHRGAALQVDVTVPRTVIERSRAVTLACRAGGVSLAPQTYSSPGKFILQRSLPPLSGEVVLSCTVDKVIPPGNGDLRELGIIVSSIALAPL